MPLLIYSRLTGSRERERWGRETAKIARLQCACWPTQPGLYHMAPMACGVADLTSEPGNLCHMSLPHLSPPFLSVYSILPIKAKKAERISKEKRGKKRSPDRESNRLCFNTSEPMQYAAIPVGQRAPLFITFLGGVVFIVKLDIYRWIDRQTES